MNANECGYDATVLAETDTFERNLEKLGLLRQDITC
jgi:hypothetical protein